MTSTQTNAVWFDEFILALRLRDVRGESIGDAVAVVRGHLADSGESAHEAFGDPRAYAGELELPTVAGPSPMDPAVMGPALSLVGLLAFAPAVGALFAGTSMGFSLPQLLLFLVPVALVLGLPWYFNLGLRHLWVFAVAFSLAVVAATGAGLFAPERGHPALASGDPWWVAIASGALLLAASAWAIARALRAEPDHLVDPTGQDPTQVPRGHRLLAVVPHLLMPAAALVCVVGEAVLG